MYNISILLYSFVILMCKIIEISIINARNINNIFVDKSIIYNYLQTKTSQITDNQMIEELFRVVEKSISNSGKTKKYFYEGLGMTATGFAQSLERKSLSLNNFIKLCELLKLEPSTFFLENNGVIQNATNSSNVSVNQNVGAGGELELLRQDNKRLAEQIELYKKLLESYQK